MQKPKPCLCSNIVQEAESQPSDSFATQSWSLDSSPGTRRPVLSLHCGPGTGKAPPLLILKSRKGRMAGGTVEACQLQRGMEKTCITRGFPCFVSRSLPTTTGKVWEIWRKLLALGNQLTYFDSLSKERKGIATSSFLLLVAN